MQTIRTMNDVSTIDHDRAVLADVQRQIGLLNAQHVTLSNGLDDELWKAYMGDQKAQITASKISIKRAGVERERDRLRREVAALNARIETMAEGEHDQYRRHAPRPLECIMVEAQRAQDELAAQIIAAGETGQRLNYLGQEWIRACADAARVGEDISGHLKSPAPAAPLFQPSILTNPADEVARWKRNYIDASTLNPSRADLPRVRVVPGAGHRARAVGRGSVRSKGSGPCLRQYRDIFTAFESFQSPEAMAIAAHEAAHAIVAAALGYRVSIVYIEHKSHGVYSWRGRCLYSCPAHVDGTTRLIEDSVITVAARAGLDRLEGIVRSSHPEGLFPSDATKFLQAVVTLGEDYGSFLTTCLARAGHLLDQHALAWRHVTYDLLRFRDLEEDHLRTIAPVLFSRWEQHTAMHPMSFTRSHTLPAQRNATSKAETIAVCEEL